MSYFLRVSSFPPLSQITAIPQIVIIDQTGPSITFGTQAGAACMVGEFVAGSFVPTEMFSPGDVTAQYTADGKIYPYLSQDGSSPAIQNGAQVRWNGNGIVQMLKLVFQRLILQRVDTEAVTTDQGTTKANLTLTVTVATSDQDGSGNTGKDIVIPAGGRFGNAVFGSATIVFAVSGNITVPKGTPLTSNQFTVQVPCFPIRVVEPVVATAIAAVNTVIDAVLQNVAATTVISTVTNATALWPQGVGTTLATRTESQYPAAINKTRPTNTPMDAISIIWAARRAQTIRQALVQNAIDSSSDAPRGRIACLSADPPSGTSSAAASAGITAAIGLATTDGYAQPADRAIICFPLHKVFADDLGIKITRHSDSLMACTLSNFAEEVNPGASNPFIQNGIVELEDAYVSNPLSKQAQTQLIAGGVASLYRDTKVGWQFMQGVTAANPSLFPTFAPIKRRRMADLIQATIDDVAAPYQKSPATVDNIDAVSTGINDFLETLLSPDLPPAQRIVSYLVDDKSGNTQPLLDAGGYVWLVYVKLLASLDYMIFSTKIGETVTIPTSVQAAA